MNTREQFWSAVDAELDARRDPLANTELRAWMREHEADALELVDLCRGLALLTRVPQAQSVTPTVSAQALPRARARRTLVPLAAAALLASVALVAWLVLRPRATATPALTAAEELMLHPVVPAPELGTVHSWRAQSSLETSRGTCVVSCSANGRATEEQHTPQHTAHADALASVLVLATHEESWCPR